MSDKPRQSSTSQIVVGMHEFEALIRKVGAASNAELFPLLDEIGQQQEDSARRRIGETKESPDGSSWDAWSEPYARRRLPHHSLLSSTGALLDSMAHEVDESGKAVEVGSSMIYARRHLFGDAALNLSGGIPARPFLDTDGGFADSSDRRELRDIALRFLSGLL